MLNIFWFAKPSFPAGYCYHCYRRKFLVCWPMLWCCWVLFCKPMRALFPFPLPHSFLKSIPWIRLKKISHAKLHTVTVSWEGRAGQPMYGTCNHVGHAGKCTALLNRFPPFFSWRIGIAPPTNIFQSRPHQNSSTRQSASPARPPSRSVTVCTYVVYCTIRTVLYNYNKTTYLRVGTYLLGRSTYVRSSLRTYSEGRYPSHTHTIVLYLRIAPEECSASNNEKNSFFKKTYVFS